MPAAVTFCFLLFVIFGWHISAPVAPHRSPRYPLLVFLFFLLFVTDYCCQHHFVCLLCEPSIPRAPCRGANAMGGPIQSYYPPSLYGVPAYSFQQPAGFPGPYGGGGAGAAGAAGGAGAGAGSTAAANFYGASVVFSLWFFFWLPFYLPPSLFSCVLFHGELCASPRSLSLL